MNYISGVFALFAITLLIFYYLLPKKLNLQGAVLLIGSLIFYLCFDVRYIIFLLFTAISTYFTAILIKKTHAKKIITALCIIANIAIWFAIKALPWTISMGNAILKTIGSTIEIGSVSLIAPIGISYFTLQAIGYLVDVYKEKFAPEKSFLKYFLFLSYFPAIVQGPISKYDQLAPCLVSKKRFSFEEFRTGLLLISFGCVKKIVIADRLAILVNNGFAQFKELNSIVLYFVAVGYAIQLYMDFSGCVDICRGVSKLFGISLVNNFNRPYLATSIKEFWAKWHISLSNWLKDYIYIPLGGNRKGTGRKYLNLLITFLVSGLWHGAGISFFVWGAFHAIYQIIGQCTEKIRARFKKFIGIKANSTSEKIYKTVITFNLVTFAWVFFRATSFRAGIEFLQQMFLSGSFAITPIYELGVGKEYLFLLALHLIVFFAVEYCTKSQDCAVESIINKHLIIRWVIYLVLIFDVILFGVYGQGYDVSDFMYGGF